MTDQDVDTLFHEALEVINRVLTENGDRPVFGRVVELADTHLSGLDLTILVYEDDPASRLAHYTVTWDDGRLRMVTPGKGPHDAEWKVSREYLQSLVDDPEMYVEHPTRLDLDWLATRIPDGARQLFRWGTRAPE